MFIFKSISTKDMKIIVEEPENLIAKAPLKHEVLNIEGRDDAIYHPLGYAPVEIPLTLQLLDPSKIDQILMWLNGEGELVYKNRKTKARIFSEIQPIRTAGIRIINIEIIRAPFWYDLEDEYSEAWGTNLIPNGWDSFEPYGSGENYMETFDTNRETSNWRLGFFRLKDSHDLKKGDRVVLRMKCFFGEGRDEFRLFSTPNAIPEGQMFRKDYYNEETHILEFEFIINNPNHVGELVINQVPTDLTSVSKIEWMSLSKVNNQHLVVEKTPLENGLTRIQTWGGNGAMKLLHWSKDTDEYITKSVNLENIGDNSVEIDPNTYGESVIVRGGEKKHVVITGKRQNPAARNQFKIRALNVSHSLDFIASTPIIVEGDASPTWEADANPRIVNEGTAPSKPLIKLTKGTSSTCEFEVNGVYFKYHFNHDTEVLIDCEKMEASDNGQLRNRHLTIGYEFPVLDSGPNVVKRISGDAKIEFKRKDRWL